MIDKLEYVQAAALVKIEEKKMLSQSRFIRLIEAESASEVLKLLGESVYSKDMSGITEPSMYDKILSEELKRVYKFAYEIAKVNSSIVDIFALKYDFQTLKFKLKASVKEEEYKEEYLTNLDLTKEYLEARKEYESTKDVQMAVILLDKLYLKRVKDIVEEYDEEILKKFYKLKLDRYNLLTFLRLKKQNRNNSYAKMCLADDEDLVKIYESGSNFVEALKKKYDNKVMWEQYGRCNRISDIEKYMDNSIMDLCKKYRAANCGIEPIVTFILAKEFEMKAIKLIMTAKINKLPEEVIRERMRDIYV